jgi:hypothetical protein
MAKRNHSPGFKNTTCSKCGASAHSKPGEVHRRCTGSCTDTDTAQIRPKHNLIPGAQRGKWS